MPWQERAIDRSPAVQRSRQRSIEQARAVIAAAQRLMQASATGDFTVQQLAAEAGIALQTFYRYFTDKDELLLAVLEELIAQGSERIAAEAAKEPDPLGRLRSLIVQVASGRVNQPAGPGLPPRVVTHLHFKLQEQNPREVEGAVRPYVDLVRHAIDECAAAGLIDPLNSERDAWAINNLVLAKYHNASVGAVDEDPEAGAEHIWQFCLSALRPVTPVTVTPASPRPNKTNTNTNTKARPARVPAAQGAQKRSTAAKRTPHRR